MIYHAHTIFTRIFSVAMCRIFLPTRDKPTGMEFPVKQHYLETQASPTESASALFCSKLLVIHSKRHRIVFRHAAMYLFFV